MQMFSFIFQIAIQYITIQSFTKFIQKLKYLKSCIIKLIHFLHQNHYNTVYLIYTKYSLFCEPTSSMLVLCIITLHV